MSDRMAELRGEVAATIGEIEQLGRRLETAPSTQPGPERRSDAWSAADSDYREVVRIGDAVMPVRVKPEPRVARPWSPAAAMEPVAPAPTAGATDMAPRDTRAVLPPLLVDDAPPRRRAFVARLVIAALAATGIVLSALLLAGVFPSGSRAPVAQSPAVSLTSLRVVAAAGPQDVPMALSRTSFPAGTATVYIDARYQGDAADSAMRIALTARPATAPQTSTTLLNREFLLSRTGESVIALTAPGGTFAPGEYSVSARVNGAVVGLSTFHIG